MFGAMEDCREPARDIPLVTNVMRKVSAYAKAGSSLREFPRIFFSIYPQKPKSAFFIALFSHL